MQRVPEPEVMHGLDQCVAYAEADFADVNKAFVERFLELFPDTNSATIVDLGCGPCDIPIRLCRARPGLSVVAIDASEPMLDLARSAVAAAGLGDRIAVRSGLFPGALAEDTPSFDVVVSNSLLHHLADPDSLWAETRRLGASGAAVLVIDLMRPNDTATAHELVEQYAEGAPDVLKHDFYHSLLAAYRTDEITAQLRARALHETLEVAPISDRHLCVWGRLP